MTEILLKIIEILSFIIFAYSKLFSFILLHDMKMSAMFLDETLIT